MKSVAEFKRSKKWENELNKCIRCGYCYELCPLYKTFNWESDTPRGKLLLTYGLASGEIKPSQEIAEKLFQCFYCENCTSNCSAGVPITDILTDARKDFVGMVKIVCQGMRLVGVVFAFPVGLLCGLYKPIFNLWVGPQYQSLYWLAVILTSHVSLNVSCYPLFAIQDAFNEVKIPSLFSCFMAGIYFLLAFSLGSRTLGLGAVGVALAGALTLTLNHAVFNTFYTSFLLKISPWRFYRSFLPGILGGVSLAVLMRLILYRYKPASLYGLLILILVAGLLYCLVAWNFLLSAPEREFMTNAMSRIRKK